MILTDFLSLKMNCRVNEIAHSLKKTNLKIHLQKLKFNNICK